MNFNLKLVEFIPDLMQKFSLDEIKKIERKVENEIYSTFISKEKTEKIDLKKIMSLFKENLSIEKYNNFLYLTTK